MANFYKVNGHWLTSKQMAEHRKKLNKLAEIFCEWCISKATRHTKDCPTRNEGFDKNTTPKLSLEERELLRKQKDEINNKGEVHDAQHTASQG